MATTTVDSHADDDGMKRNEKKWGRVLLDAGWSMIPVVILKRQQALGLDAKDINIILHLIRHWWYAERLPYPSKREIADCMGIDVSTVRRRIQKLEVAGFVKRLPRSDSRYGQQTNAYDLSGLIREVEPFAKEEIEERKKRHEEAAEKLTRKRPRLHVVPLQKKTG